MGDRACPLEDLVSETSGSRPLDELLASHFDGRRVVLTGHTGFVGSWLAAWLAKCGADIVGISLPTEVVPKSSELEPPTTVRNFELDIRDRVALSPVFGEFQPEFVFHLAAQALVLPSYRDPLATFETNVLGGAYVLEAMRQTPSVKGCVFVTSDKCYTIRDGAHTENDCLGGDDPYSASKGAAEIVAHAYRSSFFEAENVGLATARAGNILGGGDLGQFRLIPDCIRAIRASKPVELRHPSAVRPWQHVLDAVAGYLRLACALIDDPAHFAQPWNFGPSPENSAPVGDLVTRFVERWRLGGEALDPVISLTRSAGEREYLVLNSEKARNRLGWRTVLDLDDTVDWTVRWYQERSLKSDTDVTAAQIERYIKLDRESSNLDSDADVNHADG